MKTTYNLLLTLCLLLVCQGLFAQQTDTDNKPVIAATPVGHATKSPEMTVACRGVAVIPPLDPNWQAVLIPPSNSPNESEEPNELTKIKLEKYRQKLAAPSQTPSNEEAHQALDRSGAPAVGNNFQGNYSGGCPLDNTVAISDGGYIVSCVNSNIQVYNESGVLLSNISLYDFFGPIFPSFDLCDPKVLYDGPSNRFILYVQVCDGQPSDEQVLLAFSQGGNPVNGWWIYSITGNPLNDNSWLDYPKIGVSNNEFYLTGNLYYASGGYNQSILYQIPKLAGYNGQNLSYQWWYNIDGNPFTLLPLTRGQSVGYGPGIYLVASRSGGGNSVEFYDLTADMSSSNEQLVQYTVSIPSYSVPPYAGQLNTSYPLDAGDCRMMDGFYLNGYAHFVFSEDITNWSSIRYTRLRVNDLTTQYAQATFQNEKDYSYPSVASFSQNTNDQSVIVGFLASGNSYYPEMRAKLYNNNMNTSSSILVKEGNGYNSTCFDSGRQACRWGDYSGLSRKHNANNATVWMGGMYGGFGDGWYTWIAQIYDTGVSVKTVENEAEKNQIDVMPNPTRGDLIRLAITVDQPENVQFLLFDESGKLIQNLYEGHLLGGENLFSFSPKTLSAGAYYLKVISKSTQKVIAHEKVVVTP